MKKVKDDYFNNINPLNLKDNYEDNVKAFKLIINLSNNNEVKLLGQQIIDSFLLLCIIQNNKLLKNNIKSYSTLINKLSISANKVSKFEKILRNNDIRTNVFLADKYLFVTDYDKSKDDVESLGKNAVNKTKSYLIYDKENNYSFSLNEVLSSSNLLNRIVCKDENKTFSSYVSSFAKNNISDDFSDVTTFLLEKKDNLFSKTISLDDNISAKQNNLYNKISDLSTKLISIEYNIQNLENIINVFSSRLFVLEEDVKKVYNEFRDECNSNYFSLIKERIFVHEVLNNYVNNYEALINSEIGISNITLTDSKPINLEDELMDDDDLSIYSSYLIYKAGVNNPKNAVSFDKYCSYIYGKDISENTIIKK